MLRNLLLFFTLMDCTVFGQQIGIGVKGGVRATNDIKASFETTSESSRYVVGPMVEVTLPLGFSLEADALYSRIGYQSDSVSRYFNSTNAHGNSWEFPVVLKHGFGFPFIHPYGELGYAPRRTGTMEYVGTSYTLPAQVSHGLVAGLGAEGGIGRIRIAAEARYTRWNKDVINEQSTRGYFVNSGLNQVQVLLGLSWRTKR